MRILICGDRDWMERSKIRAQMEIIHAVHVLLRQPVPTLIHGAARGADEMAGEIGTELGWEVLSFPANWKLLGRGAGPLRNAEMIKQGRPDLALAFHPDLAHSKGTADMVRKLRGANVPTWIFK